MIFGICKEPFVETHHHYRSKDNGAEHQSSGSPESDVQNQPLQYTTHRSVIVGPLSRSQTTAAAEKENEEVRLGGSVRCERGEQNKLRIRGTEGSDEHSGV